MQPACELAQLGVGGGDLFARLRHQLAGTIRVGRQRAPRQVQELRDGDELLLRAVVEVARDARALGVGGLDGRLARGFQFVLALAQRGDLVEQVGVGVLGERAQ
jgi:hypothetical protein